MSFSENELRTGGQCIYSVYCTFNVDAAAARLPEKWLAWLHGGHIEAVLAGGASSATVIELDCAEGERSFRVDYLFNSREDYQTYAADTAPDLQQEGLELFPPNLGLAYSRSVGFVAIHRVS